MKIRPLLTTTLLLGTMISYPAIAQDERFPEPAENTAPAQGGMQYDGPGGAAQQGQDATGGMENTNGSDIRQGQGPYQNIMDTPTEPPLPDIDEEMSGEMTREMATQDGTNDSLPRIDPSNDPDTFYDSMPVQRGTQESAPEKMNPETSPAGKYIIVTKDYDKDDNKSMLVSANRALKLGRYDAALDMYDRLYKKNPRDERILMGRAIALQRMDRTQLAIKTYEELLEVDPDNVAAEISMLGLVRTRYPALALKQLASLYDNNPNNAALAAQMGLTHADLGNIKDAKRYLGAAVSMEPNNAGYYYNLGVVADRAKDYKTAIRFYEDALSKDSIYGGGRSVPRDAIYDRLAVLRAR